MRLIVLCVISFVITYARAEDVSVVYFDFYPENQTLDLTDGIFPIYHEYKDRTLMGIRVYAASKDIKKPLSLQLRVNNEVTSKLIQPYEIRSRDDIRPIEFSINPTLQKDIHKISLSFSVDSFILYLQFIFDDNSETDFEGSIFEPTLNRLEQLSEYNLYEEFNWQPMDKLIRKLATQELHQYPSRRAAMILLERFDYEGVWIDYELHKEAKKSLNQVIDQLIISYGEDHVASLLAEIYDEAIEFRSKSLVVDRFAEFVSSAALYFVIKIHTYSPTSLGNLNSNTLKQIYSKDDFPKFMEIYKEQILREIVDPFVTRDWYDYDEPSWIWAIERACESFALAPQYSLVKSLFPFLEFPDHSLAKSCSESIKNSAIALDLSSEFLPMENELIKIITEPHHPYPVPTGYYHSGFTRSQQTRVIAAYGLAEIGSTHGLQALHHALQISELEVSVRNTIEQLLW